MTGWDLFATATAVLFFKHLLTIFVQAGARMQSGRFRHPEDAKMLNAQVGDPPLAERGQELIRNSLENEPIFLLLLFAFVQVRVSAYAPTTYVWVFLGARFVHMLLFLRRIAGLRTLAYSVGMLATIGLAVQILLKVLE